MKRIITTTLATACMVCTALAEGYQVNNLSARQQGMGSAGVAMSLGAESQLFNPGALALSDKSFEISGAITATASRASATHEGVKYTTDNDISTPLCIASSFKIYDRLQAGIILYTPFGSGIKWGTHWPGAVLNQEVSIKCFSLQPTFSFRIAPGLAVGAGVTVNWGNVDLDKGLVTGNDMNRIMGALGMPAESMYAPGTTPASVNLKGDSRIAVGFNVGAIWQINKSWSVGASFRSHFKYTVEKGNAHVSYTGASEKLLTPVLDNLNSTNFRASLPAPYVFTAGVAYKPIPELTLAFDAQLNGWKTYRHLDIEFDKLDAFNQHLVKNYKNAMTYHLGAQWQTTKRLQLRCGLMVDTNPCDSYNYNPETPGQTRINPSVGLSFNPLRQLAIDFAFTYVHGCGTDNATGHYDNLGYKIAYQLNPQLPAALGISPTGSFTADYRVHAFLPSLGVRYSF